MTFAALFVLAYFIGAIPFGVIVCRAYGIDLFAVGSGNIGATNVKRALGDKWGLAVWVLDVLKSLVPTLVARSLIHDKLGPLDPQTQWFLVGLAAIIGHCASIFLRFRGGKGISTALGAIVGSSPVVAGLCFGLFAIVLAVTRYMAIASIVGVSSVIVFSLVVPGNTLQLLPVYALLAAFVVYRHRANLKRLREGTEPKFGFGKSKSKSPENPEKRENN